MPEESAKLLSAEISKLEPSALIELFILDARVVGGEIFYFHAGTNQYTNPITYLGDTYYPIPVQVRGYEFKGKGELPRPRITFSNIGGFIKDLSLLYNDLVGALVIRRRVFADFLDGEPRATGHNQIPDDIFSIERKVNENKFTVEFELGTSFEVDGVQLPRRQIMSALCGFEYRGDGCFFSQKRVVADFLNKILGEASRYQGYWNSSTNYRNGNSASVVYTDHEIVYLALQASSGKPPIEFPSIWIPKMRVKYQYKSTEVYAKNDVIYTYGLRRPNRPLYFIANRDVPAGIAPPNKNYWDADECAKNTVACGMRHDPLNQRLPLPFGGFPGTVRIPDTI